MRWGRPRTCQVDVLAKKPALAVDLPAITVLDLRILQRYSETTLTQQHLTDLDIVPASIGPFTHSRGHWPHSRIDALPGTWLQIVTDK